MDAKSASRTLDLFELFAVQRQPLTLSEMAAALDAPISSCFNLVRLLKARGFLYAASKRRQIYPTRKMFDMAAAIATGEPWAQRFAPRLEALRDRTDETTILGVEQDGRVIYLAVVESRQNIRYSARPGDLKPLHSSSIGKALVASLKPGARAALVGAIELAPMTGATITDRAQFAEEIERTATRGYAATAGENVADVMAIAMPVQVGDVTYGIAVAGPMPRMKARFAEHQRALAETLRGIGDDH